ncbi:response regulator [Salidesulfovibrio brasiliensis]|uniref:response regulator n=1 Tax=Salidesulfovibrio brasiliensis TaxID=221711 RepID=UPI0006D0D3A1|nr:response regulator [Salidesulfovibrio brasiliensis]
MKRRFLIVDDDERFAELVSLKLGEFGSCDVATGGEDALEIFERRLKEKSPFDAVFMDIVMPEMDGHEVVRRLRQLEKRYGVNAVKSFKLIMLTAHSDIDNVGRSFFDSLADAFLTKSNMQGGLQSAMRDARLI